MVVLNSVLVEKIRAANPEVSPSLEKLLRELCLDGEVRKEDDVRRLFKWAGALLNLMGCSSSSDGSVLDDAVWEGLTRDLNLVRITLMKEFHIWLSPVKLVNPCEAALENGEVLVLECVETLPA